MVGSPEVDFEVDVFHKKRKFKQRSHSHLQEEGQGPDGRDWYENYLDDNEQKGQIILPEIGGDSK